MPDSHSVALMAKHARLETQINFEEHRARPDDLLIGTLKKQKLKIKEALTRL